MSDSDSFDVKRMFKLSNNTYDILRYFATVVIPGFGALYFGLAGYWDLPNADAVVGTTIVVDTFIGLLLQASKKAYEADEDRFDGSVEIVHDEEGTAGARVLMDIPAIVGKDELKVKVVKEF